MRVLKIQFAKKELNVIITGNEELADILIGWLNTLFIPENVELIELASDHSLNDLKSRITSL